MAAFSSAHTCVPVPPLFLDHSLTVQQEFKITERNFNEHGGSYFEIGNVCSSTGYYGIFQGKPRLSHQATPLCWEPHRLQAPDEESAILGFSELTVDKKLHSAVSAITVSHMVGDSAKAQGCSLCSCGLVCSKMLCHWWGH